MTSSTALEKDSVAGRFFRGAVYPLAGYRYIAAQKLWGLASLSILANVLAFVLVLAGVAAFALPYLVGLDAWLGSLAAEGSLLDALLGFAASLVWVLSALALFVGAGLVVVLLGQAIASPFLDLLSERVEAEQLGGANAPMNAARLVRVVRVSVTDLVGGLTILLLVQLPLFAVGLVPIVGTIPATVGGITLNALLFAHEFVGLSYARRLVSYGGRWRIVRANLAVCLGFGLATLLMLLVPLVNLVLLPIAAVGGTLLFCDLERGGLGTRGATTTSSSRAASSAGQPE